MMSMTELIPFIREFGVPVMALVLLARWFAPRADKIIDGHLTFLKNMGEQVQRQTDIQESQSHTMTLVADTQKQHGDLLKDIHTASKRFSPVVVNPGPTTVQAPGKKSDAAIVVPS
jgi:hypothetical protein